MKLEDLKLYQECLDFEQEVWNIVNGWEGFNKDTVGKPLYRQPMQFQEILHKVMEGIILKIKNIIAIFLEAIY